MLLAALRGAPNPRTILARASAVDIEDALAAALESPLPGALFVTELAARVLELPATCTESMLVKTRCAEALLQLGVLEDGALSSEESTRAIKDLVAFAQEAGPPFKSLEAEEVHDGWQMILASLVAHAPEAAEILAPALRPGPPANRALAIACSAGHVSARPQNFPPFAKPLSLQNIFLGSNAE